MIADKQLEIDFVQTIVSIGEESPGRLNAEVSAYSVKKDFFTDDFLWKVFSASKALAAQGSRLDSTGIAAVLGPEERPRLQAIYPDVPRPGNSRVLYEKLRAYSIRRAASEIGRRIIRLAEDSSQDVGSGLVEAAAALQTSYSTDGSGIKNGSDVLLAHYDELERAQLREDCQDVIKTGIVAFDEITGGIPRKFVTIIGAHPGCFKSGLMATIAANVASRGRKVGIFSLEDNATFVAKRFNSRATGIPVEELGKRRLTDSELMSIAEKQDSVLKVMSNIVFHEGSDMTGHDVSASARCMIHERGVELIVIDHCGELVTRAADRRKDRYDLDVAGNVKAIRNISKDTGVPVLMAAHLKRRAGQDEDIHMVPTLTDFADSSSIEKMTRLALGLWQPENPNQIALKVLKQNEGGSRGRVFFLNKAQKSALVQND